MYIHEKAMVHTMYIVNAAIAIGLGLFGVKVISTLPVGNEGFQSAMGTIGDIGAVGLAVLLIYLISTLAKMVMSMHNRILDDLMTVHRNSIDVTNRAIKLGDKLIDATGESSKTVQEIAVAKSDAKSELVSLRKTIEENNRLLTKGNPMNPL